MPNRVKKDQKRVTCSKKSKKSKKSHIESNRAIQSDTVSYIDIKSIQCHKEVYRLILIHAEWHSVKQSYSESFQLRQNLT